MWTDQGSASFYYDDAGGSFRSGLNYRTTGQQHHSYIELLVAQEGMEKGLVLDWFFQEEDNIV